MSKRNKLLAALFKRCDKTLRGIHHNRWTSLLLQQHARVWSRIACIYARDCASVSTFFT